MIKVAQFGEGNFLRTFVDAYFDNLNKTTDRQYEVHIIQPIPFGHLDNFKKQNNRYHIVLRGTVDNKDVEDVYGIDCVKDVFSPFEDIDKYYSLARDEELKIIVSNTTEAGICFNESDKISDFMNMTYPGKLTSFLYERFKAKKSGLYI